MRAYALYCDGVPTDIYVWDMDDLGADPIDIADYAPDFDTDDDDLSV